VSTNQDYILNSCTIDYIRLATFNFQRYCKISALLSQRYVGWRSGRWLQYNMQRSQDNVSYGIGEQSKKPHAIFEASGQAAHVLAVWFFQTQQIDSDDIYCTRLDLQVTKHIDARPDYVKLHKRLPGPKQLILGDDGNTLYSGNRQSDSFYRLYDKTEKHIRLEVELKGRQARRAWLHYMETGEVSEIYNYYIKRTKIPAIIANEFASPVELADLSELPKEEKDNTKSLEWLKTLDTLVYKLANDHDLANETAQVISRWYEYVTKD
jgi:hypothetical protein